MGIFIQLHINLEQVACLVSKYIKKFQVSSVKIVKNFLKTPSFKLSVSRPSFCEQESIDCLPLPSVCVCPIYTYYVLYIIHLSFN